MKDLHGRTAIVTGASRGLGVYIARALAAEGMNLALAARTVEALLEVREELAASFDGPRFIAVQTDVTRPKDQERLLRRTAEELGPVDVLVNNAGIEMVYTYHNLDPAEIDEVIDVNLRAPMRLARLVLPGMLERGAGHIINISSLAGKYGPAHAEPYGATKAGLIGFTQSLRASYRASGVSASVICPGFVAGAGMYARSRDEGGPPAPRTLGESRPEDVAEAVLKALRKDLPEVIVNPTPLRPVLGLVALAPTLGEKLSKRVDATDMLRAFAAHRERLRRQADGAPLAASDLPAGDERQDAPLTPPLPPAAPSGGDASRRRGTSR